MRLVIDLQGAQTESSFRGIGRYSLALAQALVRQRGPNEVLLALNGMFPEAVERLRGDFDGLLSQDQIRVWDAVAPVRAADPANISRRTVAERLRETFIASLQPDAVLVTSLFEGFGDDAVTSIGAWDAGPPTATVLYDLIPLLNPDDQFRASPLHRDWYARKIESLRRSQLMLAISESSRQEAITALGTGTGDVISISGACDTHFREMHLSPQARENVMRRAGLQRPFVMYTGGADERKNLHRLIASFAALPPALRERYQVALVGRMPPGHVADLRAHGTALGLGDELVFTGYVSDADLVRLYNCCELLLFPSLHEGLGLPPLEAMACGAPVIGANATSLTEIIGLQEAMFDPTSVPEIAAKLEQGLSDPAFRQRLREHGHRQFRKFTWEATGEKCWAALQRFAPAGTAAGAASLHGGLELRATGLYHSTPRRILVQKLDHRGDLLLALPAISKLRSRYPTARIDGLVGSWNLAMAEATKLFDRVYTLDFFRTASAEAPALIESDVAAAVRAIGHCDIAIDLRRQSDTRRVLARIDSDLRVGYETFDPAVDAALHVKLRAFADVPFETTPLNKTHICEQMLRLVDALPASPSDYLNLPTFGTTTPRQGRRVALFPAAGNDVKQWDGRNFIALAQRLAGEAGIDAVDVYFGSDREAASFEAGPSAKIVRHVGLSFADLTRSLAGATVCVANNSFGVHIAGYMGATVIGVYGGHETVDEWAPPFGNSFVLHAGRFCSPCHIPTRGDCPYEMACLTSIPVQAVFDQVIAACEGRLKATSSAAPAEAAGTQDRVGRLVDGLSELLAESWSPKEMARVAACVSGNHRLLVQQKQLLVDVSELVKSDARSGIQRVVRAILLQLLREPPDGYVVEPVYARHGEPGYRYARAFKNRFSGKSPGAVGDDQVETWSGDIFLGLDLNPTLIVEQEPQLQDWRKRGVRVLLVIYDLLPILLPKTFDAPLAMAYAQWLNTVARLDGAVAISRTVAEELLSWLQHYGPPRVRKLPIGWFHLGSALGESAPSQGVPATAPALLAQLASAPVLLMVGTLEPRKAHAEVLAACDLLWARGVKVNLVLVGKAGWLLGDLVSRLRMHKEAGRQLHWLEGISDEYLEQIYARSTALVAASLGEGFGLPLVEGAAHGLALIARDIPVFREVAGDAAYYFPRQCTAQELADSLSTWLGLHAKGLHPKSGGLKPLNWRDSTAQLLRCVVGASWPLAWQAQRALRFSGADSRMHTTPIGQREGMSIRSTGAAGNLVFGPYLTLRAGHHRMRMWGQVEAAGGHARFDVVHDSGRLELISGPIAVSAAGTWTIERQLVLAQEVSGVEFRVWIDGGTSITFDGLEIAPVDDVDDVDSPTGPPPAPAATATEASTIAIRPHARTA